MLGRSLLAGLTLATATVSAHADITIDLGRGPVTVHCPSTYDPAVPAPLIVLLHGYTGSGEWMEGYFDLEAQSEKYGFLYMAPNGYRDEWGLRYWNATDACCDFFAKNHDDSGYLRALVEEVQNQLNVNDRRIHFTGLSNGAFMSYRMACDHGDLVASIAGLAGATWLDDSFCPRPEPVHILHIHGTLDDVIFYDGGSTGMGEYPGAIESVRTWVVGNGCKKTRDESCPPINVDGGIPGDETTIIKWESRCPLGGSGELWTINDGGHVPNLSVDFPALLADWFMAHPKPGVWSDLGHGLGGTNGIPTMTPSGSMQSGDPIEVAITDARPDTGGFLVIGFEEWYIPFAGGTLVPALDYVIPNLKTDALGDLVLTGTWPQDVPPAFETVYQHWIVDPIGPAGFAATNAVKGISP